MAARLSIIVAMSPEGVIGLDGRIPWHYASDLKRFKRLTTGTTVIMGRRTWESIGSKPLPERRNIVITRADLPDVECFRDIPSALERCAGQVWFIGGARIYAEAMAFCDSIDVTQVPDRVDSPEAVRFPPIDPEEWVVADTTVDEEDSRLRHTRYARRGAADSS